MKHAHDRRPRPRHIAKHAACLIAMLAILGTGMSTTLAESNLALGRPNPEGTSI
jgi:hypothetical protein